MAGKLYVVATPIGNREDMTERARRVLASCDLIAAEDTRTTQNLLRLCGIENKLVSNHKFNERHQVDFLLGELAAGRDVAVVSDAGTPCVSDPGGVVVAAAAEAGYAVEGVCGASAVITALSVSGFDCMPFAFYGFLPRTNAELRGRLDAALASGVPVAVFFESPNRVQKTVALLEEVMPAARLCLCNDLTKKFERLYRGAPGAVLAELAANPNAEKGEYTLVADLRDVPPPPAAAETPATPEAALVERMLADGCSAKDAVAALRDEGRFPKKELYAASLRLKTMFGGDGEDAE